MNSFDIRTKIYFGDNALDRLEEIPYKKIMIITDPFVVQSGMIEMVTKRLDKGSKQYSIYKDVVPDPPVDKVVGESKPFWIISRRPL